MAVQLSLRDYDKKPETKADGLPPSSFHLGGEKMPGYCDFTITPQAPLNEFHVAPAGSPEHFFLWTNRVFGPRAGAEWEVFPGCVSVNNIAREPWQSQIMIRDYTNPKVIESMRSWTDAATLEKAEDEAGRQHDLVDALGADSVAEAVSATLLTYLLKAKEITRPEAHSFLYEHFDRGTKLSDVLLRLAEDEIALSNPKDLVRLKR
jgi:hypothetical protein